MRVRSELIAPLLAFAAVLAPGCAHGMRSDDEASRADVCRATPITQPSAERYAAYAMMASNAYHSPKKRWMFDLAPLDWELVDIHGSPTGDATCETASGLAYDIYRNSRSKEIVVAFRGTDSVWDWILGNLAVPVSIQYKDARNDFAAIVAKYPSPEWSIRTTGHSLGGGLALGMSVRFPNVPAVVFDTSPRVFDGLGDVHFDAVRELVYQDGEVLAKLRRLSWKMDEVVSCENTYVCPYDFHGSNLHRGDLLALGLLIHAATPGTPLAEVLRTVPQSVRDRVTVPKQ